jgi:hypothetical protein
MDRLLSIKVGQLTRLRPRDLEALVAKGLPGPPGGTR